MAGILRESCLEIIDKTYEAINSSLDGKNVDSNIWLKDLSARMERINRLRKKKNYLETIKCLDRDGLQEYFNLVGRMARELRLPIYRCFVDMEIAEEQELLTLYANGVVHERGKSIEIDQGMRIRFRLESKNQDAKQRVVVEWDKKRKGKEEQEGFYEALNDIKNMVDTDSLDREFAFEQVGEYKVSAAVYKYMKKSLIKKIKTLAQAYECTVIVNEGEELYEGMEFKDKLWEALSAVDWKGVVQDSVFDVTSQLPIMVGTIVLLSGVLIAISVSPIGWLAPMVGTAMQVFGLSGAVEDVVKGIYMFTDAILRIRDAKSKAGMSQATRHLEESFRQVAPNLMLDVLLFLGGKRVAGNPTASDLVREAPRTNLASISKVDGSRREIRVGEVTDALPPRVSDAVASPVRSEGGGYSVGDVTLMDADDAFVSNISRRIDVDANGYFDVIAHGTPNSIQITHNEQHMMVDHRTAARLIQNSDGYNGQAIRLLSCNTGALDNGFAQNLANKLNVEVYAPTDYLWSTPNGNYFVAGMSNSKVPDMSDIGSFKLFLPGGNQ
ncbi:MAG: hypothetical protein J6U88_05115 [Bacteroidales bacterium]|nr:hypothetical protein [Bacteroidales bacterium]